MTTPTCDLIALMSGAQFTGIVFLIIVFGGFAVAIWHDRSERTEREESAWWRNAFEPNRDGDLTPHTHPDQVHEYPPVPADHRDWGTKR